MCGQRAVAGTAGPVTARERSGLARGGFLTGGRRDRGGPGRAAPSPGGSRRLRGRWGRRLRSSVEIRLGEKRGGLGRSPRWRGRSGLLGGISRHSLTPRIISSHFGFSVSSSRFRIPLRQMSCAEETNFESFAAYLSFPPCTALDESLYTL